MSTHTSKSMVSVKERDYLEQDPPIRGQQFVCLSFISPEKTLQDKETYCFSKFLGNFRNDIDLMFNNLKEKFKEDKMVQEMVDALKDRYDYLYDAKTLKNEYDYFKEHNSESLDKTFLEENDFQTSVRGIKVRGTYDSLPEAKNRAEKIRTFDKNNNVFIAEVGCWCPWSPYPDEIKDQEYSETALNTLMKKYNENMIEKDEHHKERMEIMAQKIHAEEKKKKEQVNEEEVKSNETVEPTENVVSDQ